MSVRPPPLTNPRIRVATAADKNSYVRATRAGYELDLQFRWRYPFRCDFPEDAIEAMGGHFDEAVGDERATVLVAEVPRLEGGVEMGGGGGEWVIIGGVVWVWKFADEVEGEICMSWPVLSFLACLLESTSRCPLLVVDNYDC